MKGTWSVLVLALGVLACSVGSTAPSGDRPPASAPTQVVAPLPVVPTPVYVPPECEGRPLPTIESTLVVPSTQASGANPPLTTEAQLDVLLGLENAVLENYVYRDFNGLDWPAAVAEIRARVESGMDSGAFYSELQPLIQRLGDEHSYFQSPAEVNSERLGQLNFVGIGALLQARLEKRIITVLDVFPESPADHAGLRPHDIILTIDGKPGVENGGRRGTLGPACTQVVLTIQTPGQSPRQVAIVRDAVSGTLPMDEGLVPTTDGSRIGYLLLPSFLDETISGRVEQALQAFGPLDGLILDNRVNGGAWVRRRNRCWASSRRARWGTSSTASGRPC